MYEMVRRGANYAGRVRGVNVQSNNTVGAVLYFTTRQLEAREEKGEREEDREEAEAHIA